MTLKTIESMAESRSTEYHSSYFTRSYATYRLGQLDRISIARTELELWTAAHTQTSSLRRRKRIAKRINQCTFNIEREISSIHSGMNYKADSEEYSELWSERGYRIFTVTDSYTWNTSTAPFYEAERSAREIITVLESLGYTANMDVIEKEHHQHRDWYGRPFSTTSGRIAVLLRADTPIELELARRAYAAHQDAYWRDMHARYNWSLDTLPQTHFRSF